MKNLRVTLTEMLWLRGEKIPLIAIFLIYFNFSALSPEPVIHLWGGMYSLRSQGRCDTREHLLYIPAPRREGRWW